MNEHYLERVREEMGKDQETFRKLEGEIEEIKYTETEIIGNLSKENV